MSKLINYQHSGDDENKKAILKLIDQNKSARILDLGCGSGEFTIELGTTVGTEDIYGVDGAPELIKSARSKGIVACKSDLNLPFPFKDETFMLVCANQVWEHLNNTDLFLKEVFRVLVGGGGVHNFNSEFGCLA